MIKKVYRDIATRVFNTFRFSYFGKPKKVLIDECAAKLQDLHSKHHTETPAEIEPHLPYIAKTFFITLNNTAHKEYDKTKKNRKYTKKI